MGYDHREHKQTFLQRFNEMRAEEELPRITQTKMEVCQRCYGRGKYVNPSIDSNGITQSEMDEYGDDFREDYFSGRYDVRCEDCHGQNVTEEIDEEYYKKVNPALLEEYLTWLDEEERYQYDSWAERRAEMRMLGEW